jgi:hypothetical protein
VNERKEVKVTKNIVFLGLALGMLVYAVPRLDIGGGWDLPAVAGIAWICFALLIIAAHLHEILGVDEEMRRELRKIKHMKRWQLEQWLSKRRSLMEPKK